MVTDHMSRKKRMRLKKEEQAKELGLVFLKGYFQYAVFSMDEIFPLIEKEIPLNFNGKKINTKGNRLRVFLKGRTCAGCNIEASYFSLESSTLGERPHLNLYGRNKDGSPILFTRDHIIPRSKGGSEDLSNQQTMCTNCNCKKGDKLMK